VGSAPRRYLVRVDVLPFGGKPLFDEHDLRIVVGALGEDAATTGPWGNNVEGESEARSMRW